MDHELLLRWCSERAAGTLQSFRAAHEWLEDIPSVRRVGAAAAVSRPERWTWSLRSLQALGHLEVDWVGRRWNAAPPVVTTLTDGGGFALLCGTRPGALLRRLDDLGNDSDPQLRELSDEVVFDLPVPQDGGPDLRLLQARQTSDLRELCTLLGIELVDRAADRLLRALPGLNGLLLPGARTDLPGGVAPAQMTELPDQLFTELDHDTGEAGSYEIRLYDVPRYFHRAGPGRVFEAERGAVVYAELRRTDRHVLRFDPTRRLLLVPPRLRLPSLYERAATLRSGLLPRLEHVAQPPGSDGKHRSTLTLLSYANIDLRFARRLATLLGQRLMELPTEEVSIEARDPSRASTPSRPPSQPATLERR